MRAIHTDCTLRVVVQIMIDAQDTLVSNSTLDHRLKETELRLVAKISDSD